MGHRGSGSLQPAAAMAVGQGRDLELCSISRPSPWLCPLPTHPAPDTLIRLSNCPGPPAGNRGPDSSPLLITCQLGLLGCLWAVGVSDLITWSILDLPKLVPLLLLNQWVFIFPAASLLSTYNLTYIEVCVGKG